MSTDGKGRFTKSGVGYDAYATTNAFTRTISGVATRNGEDYWVRIGLWTSTIDNLFRTGASFRFYANGVSSTICLYKSDGDFDTTSGGTDVSNYVAGDTARVVHDISSGDIEFYLNDNLERTCAGALPNVDLQGGIFIYSDTDSLDSAEVNPVEPE